MAKFTVRHNDRDVWGVSDESRVQPPPAHDPIVWVQKVSPHGGVFSLWTGKGTAGRYDGDEDGREWVCGYAIQHAAGSDGGTSYYLYEDDGRGNGSGLGEYHTLAEAQAAANMHDTDPWAWRRSRATPDSR